MARPRPWFEVRGGVRFRCTGCNLCCKQPGYVHLHAHEAERIAQRVAGGPAYMLDFQLWVPQPDGSRQIDVPEGGACPLLGEEGCTVHDIKPAQCATYPFWPEVMESPASWHREGVYCEGIDPEGDLYEAPRILELLAERARTDGKGE